MDAGHTIRLNSQCNNVPMTPAHKSSMLQDCDKPGNRSSFRWCGLFALLKVRLSPSYLFWEQEMSSNNHSRSGCSRRVCQIPICL